MESKKTVVREAEEIIAKFIQQQGEHSRQFQKKSKRHNYTGIGLLLALGISLLLWGLVLYLIC